VSNNDNALTKTMKMSVSQFFACCLLISVLNIDLAEAQHNITCDVGKKTDIRYQVPNFLQKSYFEITTGYISYPFSERQLESGYSLHSLSVKHAAVRLVLFGYKFNDYLSAQITYMRPVLWVNYKYYKQPDYNKTFSKTVWANVGGLTIKPTIPVGKNINLYGEAGLGIITRNGFNDESGNTVVADANYATFLFGGGVMYNLSKKTGIQIVANYSPPEKRYDQPYTSYVGAGIQYRFQPIEEDKIEKSLLRDIKYPRQWIQIGYTTNFAGYNINNFVAGLNIFWGGNSEISRGTFITYQRNIFHSPKVFALDWGANISVLQTNKNREDFFALSLFPVFRLNLLHTKPLDTYFYYIVAGPTYISKTILDGENTGKKFTFYDAMALGFFFGKKRSLNAELRIAHYSNGNIFPANSGVKIPLTINMGYSF